MLTWGPRELRPQEEPKHGRTPEDVVETYTFRIVWLCGSVSAYIQNCLSTSEPLWGPKKVVHLPPPLLLLWIKLGQDKSEVDSARLSLTIIQFTVHVILISNTHSQQAQICKSYKSPVAMGEGRSSNKGNTGSCSCGPAHSWLGFYMVAFLKSEAVWGIWQPN